MKLYLAGPITPTTRWNKEAQFNKNLVRFHQKAAELRALGHEVFNPVEGELPLKPAEYYYARDIKDGLIAFKPDAIYIMRGWRQSFGTRQEKEWCEQHGIKTIYET